MNTTSLSSPNDELSPDLAAVIAAAVATATTKKIRVTRIRYWRARPDESWSRQVRTEIMASRRTK